MFNIKLFSDLVPNSNILKLLIFSLLITFSAERGLFTFFLHENNYTISQISFIQICFSMSLFFFEIPTGYFADRFGRLSSLYIGAILKTISLLGQYFFVNSFIVETIFFILGALALSFISGSVTSIIYQDLKDNSKEYLFGGIFSLLQFFCSLSLGLSMIFANSILKNYNWFGIYFITSIVTLSSIFFILKIKIKINNNMNNENKFEIKDIAKELIFILPKSLPFSIIYAAMTPYFLYSSILFNSQGFDKGFSSAIVGFIEIAGAIFTLIILYHLKKISYKYAYIFVSIISFFMFFNFIYNPFMAIIAFLIANSTVLLIDVLYHNYINDEIRDDRIRTSVLSAVSFLDMLCISIGFYIYGLLAMKFNPMLTMSYLSIFPLISAIILFLIRIKKQ